MFFNLASTLHLKLPPAALTRAMPRLQYLFRCLKPEEVLPSSELYAETGPSPATARIRIIHNPVQSEKNPATERDLGTRGRAVLRIAGRRTGENRWIRAFYRAGDVTVRHTGRVARVLWLEVTGFLFLCLAVIGAAAGFREYRHYAHGQSGPGKAAVAAVFTLMFVYFGVNSFWRSRRTAGK